MDRVKNVLYNVQCSMFKNRRMYYKNQCTMFNVQCTMFNVQCSMQPVADGNSPPASIASLAPLHCNHHMMHCAHFHRFSDAFLYIQIIYTSPLQLWYHALFTVVFFTANSTFSARFSNLLFHWWPWIASSNSYKLNIPWYLIAPVQVPWSIDIWARAKTKICSGLVWTNGMRSDSAHFELWTFKISSL